MSIGSKSLGVEMKYEELWDEMKNAPGKLEAGQLRRRIRQDSQFNLFVGLERPFNHRLLLLEVSSESYKVQDIVSTRALSVNIRRDHPKHRTEIELRLIDQRYVDVFTVLVDDLVEMTITKPDEQSALNAFVARLKEWQRFLEKVSPEGLSDEAQVGLYGELWFLKHYLLAIHFPLHAFTAWVGPYAAPQDFQTTNWSVEVKTTSTKHPQYLSISNEGQLDNDVSKTLLLLHLSLEAHSKNGETLPGIIDSIRRGYCSDSNALRLFEERLIAVGYSNVHRSHYEGNRYAIRKASFYQVIGNFPRLIKDMLPSGVHQVQYTIDINTCSPFAVDANSVRAILNEYEHGIAS